MNENNKTDETGVEKTVTPAVDITKIVAERVKASTEKAKNELAKSHGYASYDEMLNSGINKKLLDSGIDPDTVKPVFDEVLATHPSILKAQEILAEEAKRVKNTELSKLNEKFKSTFETLDDLPDETKSLLEKGVTLEQAYVATHYDQMTKPSAPADPVKLAQAQKEQGLSHFKTVPGNGIPPVTEVVLTLEVLNAIKRQMPNATNDQIKAFYARHPDLLK